MLLQDEVEINAFTLEMQHHLEAGQSYWHSREKAEWQGTGGSCQGAGVRAAGDWRAGRRRGGGGL